MHLGYAMYNTGNHPTSWRQAELRAATTVGHFHRLAAIAEAAKLDMLFRADVPFARMSNVSAWSRHPQHMDVLEPLTLFAALSQVTTHIGLAGTVTTTYSEPYNVARQLASLDHLSHGRSAWNVVTSAKPEAAHAFGEEALPPHRERYRRAREYLEVCKKLWDSYEDDAVVQDPVSNRYFDPAKFHPIDYRGEYVKVRGALNLSRMPQGYPVIIQAGQSEDGKDFAAEVAEVIFASGSNLDKARDFDREMRQRLVAKGRAADSLRILPGLNVMVGDSREDAQARLAALDAQVHEEVHLQVLSEDFGVELGGLPMDEPVPRSMIPAGTDRIAGFFSRIVAMIDEGLTLREMAQRYRRGGNTLCGSPAEIADHMEEWLAAEACDGFILTFPTAPDALQRFCTEVVPELQRRGLFRTEYEGTTLRDHLGLKRPPNGNLT